MPYLLLLFLTTATAQDIALRNRSNSDPPMRAMLPDGRIVTAGHTSTATIKTTPGALQPTYQPTWCSRTPISPSHPNEFIYRPCYSLYLTIHNPTGELAYATYFGGSRNNLLAALAIDPDNGDIYLAGASDVTDHLTAPDAGKTNRWLARLSSSQAHPDLTREWILPIPTLDPAAIAITPIGGIHVVSSTATTPPNVSPATPVPDIRILRYHRNGTLLDSFVFGGSQPDYPGQLLAQGEDLYLSGTTQSASDFPGDGYRAPGGRQDIFLARITNGSLVWSAVIGDADNDVATLFTLHRGKIYFHSYSNSPTESSRYLGILSGDGSALDLWDQFTDTGFAIQERQLLVDSSDRVHLLASGYRFDTPIRNPGWETCSTAYTYYPRALLLRTQPNNTGWDLIRPMPEAFLATTELAYRTSLLTPDLEPMRLNAPCLLHGANFTYGPVAPGMIVTIAGPGVSQAQRRLTANGIPMRILGTTQNQINAILPEAITPGTRVRIDGGSFQLDAPVVPSNPSVFYSWLKYPYAWNQDGSVLNGGNPAPACSEITVLATGARSGVTIISTPNPTPTVQPVHDGLDLIRFPIGTVWSDSKRFFLCDHAQRGCTEIEIPARPGVCPP